MKKIRCKFECTGNKHSDISKGSEVTFSAVVSGSEENKSFAKYTPGGELDLFIDDETEAAGFFEPGREYFLDIIDPASIEKPKQEQPEALRMKSYSIRAVQNGKSITPVVKGRSPKEMRKKAQKDYPGIKIISYVQVE